MNIDKYKQKPNVEQTQEDIRVLKELINSDQAAVAEAKIKQLSNKHPLSINLLNLLGVSLIMQNKLDEAESTYLNLIKINANFAEAYNNLGNIYLKQKKTDKAIYHFKKAIDNKPDLIQAHFNLAKIYTNLGDSLQLKNKIKESIKNYEQAINNYPDYADAHNNLGIALTKLNKLVEAFASFEKAIVIKSDYFEAHNNLGSVQIELGKNKDAIQSFQNAIKIKPDYAEAHSNLGNALNELGNFDESISHYQQAIKLKPNFAQTYNNLAASLVNQGRFDEAINNYNKALELEPEKTQYAINVNLLLPIISESVDDLKYWRNKYNSAIDTLRKYTYSINNPQKMINPPTFYLAYSNFNNLKTVKKISKLFRDIIPIINYQSKKMNIGKTNLKKLQKIRLGFISEFFTDHTIGKLYKGIIKTIDRNKFELVIFHFPNTKLGIIKDEIDSYSDKIVHLIGKIDVQQKIIENELLDIIFYPDIGMTASTYFLAYARLAPVQVVGWGHPETSGIDTIDYFLSSSFIEIKGSNSFYSEKLICLERIPMYFTPPQTTGVKFTRSDFGFSKNKNLYCCPQTLFKIHPDFDMALAKIAEKDPNSQIIMIETKRKSHMEKLRERWSKNYPNLNDNVIFLKNMPLEKFLSLIEISNVLLDPFHFGAGVSFSESMVIGTPTITMPGTFMRSRIAAGAYKQMQITNPPIATNINHYVDLAIELAKDTKKNFQLRKSLKKAAELHLFNDLKAVKQFERFLQESYKAANSASYLKDGYVISKDIF